MYSKRDTLATLATYYLRLKELKSTVELPEKVEEPVYFVDFRHYDNFMKVKSIRDNRYNLRKHQESRITKLTESVRKEIRRLLPAAQTWFQVDHKLFVGWQENDWPGDDGTLMISREVPEKKITFRTTT